MSALQTVVVDDKPVGREGRGGPARLLDHDVWPGLRDFNQLHIAAPEPRQHLRHAGRRDKGANGPPRGQGRGQGQAAHDMAAADLRPAIGEEQDACWRHQESYRQVRSRWAESIAT